MIKIVTRIMLTCLLGMAALAIGCAKPAEQRNPAQNADAHEDATHAGAHDEASHGDGASDAGSEERVEMPAAAREASGIDVQAAGPHDINVRLTLPGEVVPNAERLAHIVPRFPGIVREVRKRLGDHASQGEVLAVIEGNQSLSTYEVRSLSSGTVVSHHITLGEFVRDDADIFVIADLSTVWVDISVYARDVDRVRKGQSVNIEAVGSAGSTLGTIDYIGSSVGEDTRAATARVVLPNPNRKWKPGTFVTAKVVVEAVRAAVAVPDGALQQVEGRTCVFVESGADFVVRPVVVGRTDGAWTEIASGLSRGERIATRGSFVLKSELMKSEASHGH